MADKAEQLTRWSWRVFGIHVTQADAQRTLDIAAQEAGKVLRSPTQPSTPTYEVPEEKAAVDFRPQAVPLMGCLIAVGLVRFFTCGVLGLPCTPHAFEVVTKLFRKELGLVLFGLACMYVDDRMGCCRRKHRKHDRNATKKVFQQLPGRVHRRTRLDRILHGPTKLRSKPQRDEQEQGLLCLVRQCGRER
jgi:hypothetical protein